MIMKRTLIISLLAMLYVFSFAQTKSPHLTFKNVPIDGTLNEFVTNMKAQGFIANVDRGRKATLYGDFAGYKDCKIYVYTLQNKDLVSTIGVQFPECSTWSALEGNYLKLKEMLAQKYGNPAEVVEEFSESYYLKDDRTKLLGLKSDKCNYTTTYITEKGQLVLKLVRDDYSDCHVLLSYYDKINGVAVEAAAMEDL